METPAAHDQSCSTVALSDRQRECWAGPLAESRVPARLLSTELHVSAGLSDLKAPGSPIFLQFSTGSIITYSHFGEIFATTEYCGWRNRRSILYMHADPVFVAVRIRG